MKTLIILAHPNIKSSKINKALCESIKNTSDITLHNLHEIYPDGKIDALKEIELLKSHDKIVFQFPLYWFSSPSILKEWQDVVFSSILYGKNPKMLSGKTFQIITSIGSPKEKYTSDGRNQKSIDEILMPMNMSASYMNMKPQDVFGVYNAMGITNEELSKATSDYQKILINS
ncbi:NAD(P)H-dependent oxidoreductase [Helicobacter cappadocius]|uniref:NAD(P)H-dependent oxidoreductase n=1 Tax=Helicobacter cappadocius TaxID=3063998 RepID=A0AA90TBR3_9HELI|nr:MULTISPECIES: NAD(P)H-dependent oxidoreductase [unclassified Helicobacter]MDO7252964.1 NAD(P)H-dependent oxidoreductase [Helicobacter sp. faydin-H75]MDP2539046.1 NAD(P)H-dependent oxidoreductase [Helicobacter sp. faydin-H76]